MSSGSCLLMGPIRSFLSGSRAVAKSIDLVCHFDERSVRGEISVAAKARFLTLQPRPDRGAGNRRVRNDNKRDLATAVFSALFVDSHREQ